MSFSINKIKEYSTNIHWLNTLLFKNKKRRYLNLITILCLLWLNSHSQCNDRNFFTNRINSIYTSSIKKNETQLKGLLQVGEKMKACHLENDSSFMYLLQKTGVVYFKQGQYEQAINYTKQSNVIAHKCWLNQTGNASCLVDNFLNLRFYYKKTKQLNDEINTIDSCIFYALKSSDKFEIAIDALLDKTESLFNKGEYYLCTQYAKLGEELTKRYFHGEDSIGYIVSFLMKKANALYSSKNVSFAESFLKSQIPIFAETGYEKQLYPVYSLLGMINRDKKNYKMALSFFKKSLQSILSIKFNSGLAHNLVEMAKLYAANFNQPYLALQYCNTALKYADNSDSLFILKEIGNIYVLKGQYDKARFFYQQAFNTIMPGIDENKILRQHFQTPGFNQLQDILDLIINKGDGYLQQYYHTNNRDYLKKSIEIYKNGDFFLGKIKAEQQLQLNSNLIWRTTARILYDHAIEACYANNNTENAFYFFEKSRAILLNDQINQQQWMTEANLAKQAALKKVIVELEKKLVDSSHEQTEQLVRRIQLYMVSEALSALTKSIQIKNPFYQKKYLDTSFLTISQLRDSVLTNSKTLIEIFSGDSSLYMLTITPKTQTFNKINLRMYNSLTSSFISFIKNPVTLNKQFPDFVKTAHQLYRLLFTENNPPTGRLIISPDGKSFPFEALVMNENPQQPDYLLDHYATSYAYSVKHLTNQFASKGKTNNAVLGIAPVEYKNFPQLATLSQSDNSLKKINDYYGSGTNFIKENATYNNFLKHFPDYSIIQLYTHAADDSATNNPVIYFADSVISLSDLILDRKPNTQLVVLSACETANGKLYEGEGIFNFNRAFAAMGIPAAISNLWSVADKSTYRITELFYKYLAGGVPTDIALQKAKMEFINTAVSKEQTLPYYWAGIILTGKVDILKNNTEISWWMLSCIGIGILSASYAGLKIYSAKRKNYIARQQISK